MSIKLKRDVNEVKFPASIVHGCLHLLRASYMTQELTV